MGLFDLFRRNPDDALRKGEELLAKDLRVEALNAARGVLKRHPSHAEAARDLEHRAQEAIAHNALKEALTCQQAEMHEEAVQWLETALLHLPPGEDRDRAQSSLHQLQQRLEEGEPEEVVEEPEKDDDDAFEWDLDTHFETLVDMLRPPVASLYRELPLTFRQALVDLNEGQLAAATESFDQLVEEHPDDPVLRFERGRCRLLAGDIAEAAEDLEIAWEAFGDESLDLVGTISVPALWAEATTAAGRPGEVIERLREAADPAHQNPELSYRYGLALAASERWDETRQFFAAALEVFPSQAPFIFELAQALVHLDKKPQAVDCLETGIAPSCVGGSCSKLPKHIPSFRLLTDLYLSDQEGVRDLQRAGELLAMVEDALGRRMSANDFDRAIRFYEAIGDEETAAAARQRREVLGAAEAAGEKVPELLSEPIMRPGAGMQKRAL
ncbi:MAG: hypothetical protein AAGD01_06075 [Acidobacteriota bacterium]